VTTPADGGQADAAPFAPGSVSLRLYAHNELPATGLIDELLAQARLGIDHGFDGVMTNEHHNGFAGYLPNPIQAAGWVLADNARGWAAPCPLLLPLRPTAQVAEEVAWLDARYPGRVGVGVAAGSLEDDFAIMEATKDAARFGQSLGRLTGMLSGRDPGLLDRDPAIVRCADHPVPVLSAAMSPAAVRRAAAARAGMVFESLSTVERCRVLADAYREAGGTGSVVLIRRVWVGPRPTAKQDRALDLYSTYAVPAAQAHWHGDQSLAAEDPAELAAMVEDARQAAGADALNLRVHVPGVTAAEAREQIVAMGDVAKLLKAGRA